MGKLKIGDKVNMKFGGFVEILEEFGAGGQGTVYRVKDKNNECALKWYHNTHFKNEERLQKFYKNLEENISKGAPNSVFLWPRELTTIQNGTFGYIMDIRPNGYNELTDFFVGSVTQKQVKFKSFSAIVNAAINIISGFRDLHNNGYSYQDINNGNFFINPNTGKVLICDNDNVAPYGTNLGILGKQRYMAPEVVRGDKDPDKLSDRFSLAVILFRLLFINHPLEGKSSTPPCMTKELEKKYYGVEPRFIYDPNDKSNRPIPGTDANLKLFWNIYPDYIKELFCRAFSKESMINTEARNQRPIEKEWLDSFLKLKSNIAKCPKCGQETFLKQNGENTCMECKYKFNVVNSIKFLNSELPLMQGVKIMLWNIDSTSNDIETQIAEVVANPKNPSLLGFKNVTNNIIWRVNLPDGSQRPLEPGKIVPIKKDFVIEFTSNSKDAGKVI